MRRDGFLEAGVEVLPHQPRTSRGASLADGIRLEQDDLDAAWRKSKRAGAPVRPPPTMATEVRFDPANLGKRGRRIFEVRSSQ